MALRKESKINRDSDQIKFLNTNKVSKVLLIANILLAAIYFYLMAFNFTKGNEVLYILLIIGEVFHVWQVVGYCYTIWDTKSKSNFSKSFTPPVDVLITVCGEPVEIVEETALAAKNMDYPNFRVFLLNDGFVAKKSNWQEMEDLAKKLGIGCITRQVPGGAKAGNINNGMITANAPFVTVFDADHVPHKDFLREMVGYFIDEKVAFVQSPQYYKNHNMNYITEGAWEQQALFFGAIQSGKNRLNSVFMCGTNMVIRRDAIIEAGGMCETNIAEDFLTSLLIHEKGWKSVYVPKVLAEGLAPEDFLSYYKQQYRWTRGSLEIVFKYNPIFRRGLTWAQRIQYLASASYYLSGIIVFINAMLPIVFMYTGAAPLNTSTMLLAAVFLPYIFLCLYNLQLSSNFSYSFKALSFSIGSFYIQISALWAVLTGKKTSFSVTSKQQIQGNFLYLVIPQIIYITLAVIGAIYAVYTKGISASVTTNISWAMLNIATFIPFIIAASPKIDFKQLLESKKKQSKRLEELNIEP